MNQPYYESTLGWWGMGRKYK